MFGSGSEPGRGDNRAADHRDPTGRVDGDAGAGAPFRSGGDALLEAVLRRTVLSDSQSADLAPEDTALLADVVRRWKGTSFAVQPIAHQLVQAVLDRPFRSLAGSPAAFERMSLRIAETLCEDPVSHDRLRNLWVRLCEVAP